MHSFKDNAEREWKLSLSLGAEARVFDETGCYLSDISSTDNPVIDRVVNDPGFLGQVVWTLCKKQVEGQGLDQDDFLDAIDAGVADKAREALIEEILDFLGHRGQAIREARKERMRLVTEIETENIEAMKGLSGNEVLHMLQRLLSQANSTSMDGSVEEFAELIHAA